MRFKELTLKNDLIVSGWMTWTSVIKSESSNQKVNNEHDIVFSYFLENLSIGVISRIERKIGAITFKSSYHSASHFDE